MILNSARRINKEAFDSCNCTRELVTHIADSLWRDISNQIIHELCTKEECIFKLYPLTQIDVPETYQYEIRQRIACIKLIRCEKCEHRDEDGYCNKIEKFVPGDFFCQMGREKDCKDCKDWRKEHSSISRRRGTLYRLRINNYFTPILKTLSPSWALSFCPNSCPTFWPLVKYV